MIELHIFTVSYLVSAHSVQFRTRLQFSVDFFYFHIFFPLVMCSLVAAAIQFAAVCFYVCLIRVEQFWFLSSSSLETMCIHIVFHYQMKQSARRRRAKERERDRVVRETIKYMFGKNNDMPLISAHSTCTFCARTFETFDIFLLVPLPPSPLLLLLLLRKICAIE